MSILSRLIILVVLVFVLGAQVDAHDPPGTIFPVWHWPSSHLPVLDGDLSEWDVIPEEFWITTFDLNNRVATSTTQPEPADFNVRFAFAWNDELDRLYMAWEGFDDYWSIQRDYVELAVDADHSGGPFGRLAVQSDENTPSQRNRHAQSARLYLNGQEELIGVPSWNWHWLTEADWYREQPYSHGCYLWSQPEPGDEYGLTFEMYHVWWDDFDAAGPAQSTQHDFNEGDVIGLAILNMDGDGGQCCGEDTGEILSAWGLNVKNASENADFFTDWVLLPVDEFGSPTAVAGDTWGQIKASFTAADKPF